MKQSISPKQAARAFGVSESSLKRWCDQGLIPAERTAGGHRRLPISGVLGFVRATGQTIVDPEALGLPASSRAGPRVVSRSRDLLEEALETGNEVACRQILLDLYLGGNRIATLADEVIAPVFRAIGEHWQCARLDVYQERRACEICRRVLDELRLALPPPGDAAPLAIGGAPEEDPYVLPTMLVELVLREAGWRAVSLGSMLPFDTLQTAIRDCPPSLFWLSVSYVEDRERFVAQYADLYRTATDHDTPIIVGGNALDESLRKSMQYAAFCDNLQHLESFLESRRSESAR